MHHHSTSQRGHTLERLLLCILFFATYLPLLACSYSPERDEQREASSTSARDRGDDRDADGDEPEAARARADAGRAMTPRTDGGSRSRATIDASGALRDGSLADGATVPSNVGPDASLPLSSEDGGGTPPTVADGASPTDPAACEKGKVQASEVIFIGESFIAATNAIPRETSALARQAGTIGATESYRSLAVSGTQLTTGDIPSQFTRAVREGSVKVVLMDGGGNDLLLGNRCQASFDARCKEIVTVVEALFAQMKTNGVRDVVYFFYPDPMGIGSRIKAGMDILRPEMKKACDIATDVRCVWVDLRESWEGHYSSFTSDGIHPTAAGSMASARQIWTAMVANCIAQ